MRWSTRRAPATTASTSASIRTWSSIRRIWGSTTASPSDRAAADRDHQPRSELRRPGQLPAGPHRHDLRRSDTATYLRGNHIIKFGGEFRRASVDRSRPIPAVHLSRPSRRFRPVRQLFNITLGDRGDNLLIPAVGLFVQDSIALGANVKLDVGLRYDFIGSPTEPDNKLVVFDAEGVALVSSDPASTRSTRTAATFSRVSASSGTRPATGPRRPCRVRRDDRPDQYRLRGRRRRQSAAGHAASTCPGNVKLELDSALTTAQASGLAPTTTNPDFQPARMQTWNVNVEKELGDTGVMVGYFGSHGDRLRIPITSTSSSMARGRIRELSATSPISPGATLGNITEVQSSSAGRTTRASGSPRTAGCRRACSSARLVHALEVDRHQLLRCHGRNNGRSEQFRPRGQRRAVGLRRPSSLQPQRHVRAALPRQLL